MMDTYYRTNEMEKSKVIFDLRKFFKSQEDIVFSYIYGDFLFANFFQNLKVGVYFDSNKIGKKKWDSQVDNYIKQLIEIIPYPIEFKIINNAPLEIQIDAVRGSLLSCSNEEEKAKFLEEILKD